MDNDLMAVLTDIKTDQRLIFAKVDSLDEKFGKLPCPVNTYKITLLQRIVFGGIGIILLAFMAGLVNDKDAVKKVKTDTVASAATIQEVLP